METKVPPPSIQITPKLKKRMSCDKYECIKGDKDENVVCALFVVIGTAGIPLTAEDFLKVYVWLIQTLYAGINIDFDLHPQLKYSQLFNDAREMKGKKGSKILERETILKISRFVSGNNKEFRMALDEAITMWEAKLLIFQFLPGSIWATEI